MKHKNKKAQFVEIDFFLAIIILALGLIMLTEPFIQTKEDIQADRLSYDAITILSELQLSDINSNNPGMMANARNLNVDLIEDDSIISALTKIMIRAERENENDRESFFDLAQTIIDEALDNTIPPRYKYEVTVFSGQETYPVVELADDEKTQLASQSRTMLSGLEVNKPTSGYVASATLGEAKISDSVYEFIGGFIGQGNLTFKIDIPSDEITGIQLEGLFQDNFSISINNDQCENELQAGFVNMDLDHCVNSLRDGTNNVSIYFLGNDMMNKYVSGGIIKIDYNITQIPQTNNQNTITKRKKIPDVNGIINIYDSIYVPGTLESMTLHLDYETDIQYEGNANQDDTDTRLIMTLGNETIYSSYQNQENDIVDRVLNIEQNYESQTIPYRLGFLNLSTTIQSGQPVDLVLITDQSGSMFYRQHGGIVRLTENFNREMCGWDENTVEVRKIDLASCLTKDFINNLMIDDENADIRMGIVGFGRDVQERNIVNLTTNSDELLDFVDNNMDTALGATCVSCGIAASINLLTQSHQEREKVIVLMSDGEATERYIENESPPSIPEIIRDYEHSSGSITEDESSRHAIYYAQYPKEEMDTTIYSISFFGDGDAQQMLQDISTDADEYYFEGDDPDELTEVYQQIAQNIINVGYLSQLLDLAPELFDVFDTKLKDSYLEYTYTPTTDNNHEGLIKIKQEESFNNADCLRTFNLDFLHAELGTGFITSYSGNIWTTSAVVNDEEVFNILNYGPALGELGDPFVIGIPTNLNQNDNEIELTLNDGQNNVDECNSNNKLFYDAYFPAVFSTGNIRETSDGCTWTYVYQREARTINIPSDYEGSADCSLIDYDPNDAMQDLGYNILSGLSHDNELMIDLANSEFKISTSSIDDIPYMWGPALVGVTIWR